MKNIAILTSGGDAPGMNAAIRAVVRSGIYNDVNILGIREGYKGLVNGDIFNMDISSVADIIHRGGTMLRSSRSDEFMTEKGFKKALNVLDIFNVDGLIVLGGDGSMKGAKKISESGIPTIGIPCTIDNDLGYTDFAIGFYTAVETVVDAMGKLRDTSTSHGRANIVEVMGRDCGDIALYAGLAGGAESIIVPEMEFDIDKVAKKLINGRNRGKLHHIIVLAEGVGNAYDIADKLVEKTSVNTRVTILGHIQRGGTPSTFDRILGSEMGRRGVELLINGKSARAIGVKDNDLVDLDIVEALDIEKEFQVGMYETAKQLSI